LGGVDFYKNELLESHKIYFLIAIPLSILGGYLMVGVSPTFKVLIFLLLIMVIVLNKAKWGGLCSADYHFLRRLAINKMEYCAKSSKLADRNGNCYSISNGNC